MQIDMWFIWKTCTAIGNESLTTFFFAESTHESPNAFKCFFFLFSLFFISFSGFLSPKNFWHFKRFEFWRFVFFLLLLCNSSNNKTVADCLKGPSNGLQITSGLAFAKRPYAKIEIAKLMEKEGNSFSSGVFSVEKKRSHYIVFLLIAFLLLLLFKIMYTVRNAVRYLVYKAWENMWLDIFIDEVCQLVTFFTPHKFTHAYTSDFS